MNDTKLVTQVIFEITAYQEKDGKWQGVVLDTDSKPMVYGDKRKTEDSAIREARRALFRAIHCSHDMVYEEHSWIGQDVVGNDLYGHHGKCTQCGYVDSVESDE